MRSILHISDLHFGPPHRAEVAEGVLALAAERRPDLVVVSGDLTQRAKPRQFHQARRFVDRFEVPSVEIPGNHDVPMYRFWERFLDPYGAYRRHFNPELRGTLVDQELAIVAINTAHGWTIDNGRIRESTLDWVEARLDEQPPTRCRVLVAHHALVPAPRFGHQEVLVGARRAVRRLAAAGVELVLSGHKHQGWVALADEFHPFGLPPMVVAHAGTTTSSRGRGRERGRNSCNWVRVESDVITVTHLFWEPDRGRFAEESQHRFRRSAGEARRR